MTNSWFETRPWIATLGEVAQKPYVLEASTPLADLAATVEVRGDAEAISYYGFTLTWKEFDRWSTAFAAFLAEGGQARRPDRHLRAEHTRLRDLDLCDLEGRWRCRPAQPHVSRRARTHLHRCAGHRPHRLEGRVSRSGRRLCDRASARRPQR